MMKGVYFVPFRWLGVLIFTLYLLFNEYSLDRILNIALPMAFFFPLFPDFRIDDEGNLYIRRLIAWKRIEWSRLICVVRFLEDRIYVLRNRRGTINFFTLFIIQGFWFKGGVKLIKYMDENLAKHQ